MSELRPHEQKDLYLLFSKPKNAEMKILYDPINNHVDKRYQPLTLKYKQVLSSPIVFKQGWHDSERCFIVQLGYAFYSIRRKLK